MTLAPFEDIRFALAMRLISDETSVLSPTLRLKTLVSYKSTYQRTVIYYNTIIWYLSNTHRRPVLTIKTKNSPGGEFLLLDCLDASGETRLLAVGGVVLDDSTLRCFVDSFVCFWK